MRLTLATPAADLPIELADAKLHCRITGADEDALITRLIAAATAYLDGPSGILGRAIMQQTWLLELEDWPDQLALPIEPMISFTVSYFDSDGVVQTLSSDLYESIDYPGAATLWRWLPNITRPDLGSNTYPVRFSIVAGYATAADVPAPLSTAILMLVGHWYNHREAVSQSGVVETPMAFDALIAPYRKHI